jgi:DNA repair exonuclease SbcCD ATPase subunit
LTDLNKDDAIKFTAVLDEFAAAQRQLALGEVKKQRITVTRRIGDMGVQFELVVDEGSTAEEIFHTLDPLDGALDRLKAKADLSDHYKKILDHVGQIEQAYQKSAADLAEFRLRNDTWNENRRQPIEFTDAQVAALAHHKQTIRDHQGRIDELQKCVAEAVRVLNGESPFGVLDEQISQRLDQLRGTRPDAA